MEQNSRTAAAGTATAQCNACDLGEVTPAEIDRATRGVNGKRRASELSGEKPQTIFRSAGGRPYTSLSNEFLQDPDIPYELKGFVAECVSRPPCWRVSVPGLLSINNTIGDRGLRSIIKKAAERGFMRGVRHRRDDGTLGEVIYFVSDDAATAEQARVDHLARNIRATAVELNKRLKNAPHCHKSDVVTEQPHRSYADVVKGTQENNDLKNPSLSPRERARRRRTKKAYQTTLFEKAKPPIKEECRGAFNPQDIEDYKNQHAPVPAYRQQTAHSQSLLKAVGANG
jgi:hypothetical protein